MKLITFLYDLLDVFSLLPELDRVLLTPSATDCKMQCIVKKKRSKDAFDVHCVVDARTDEAVEDLHTTVGICPVEGIYSALKAPGMARTCAVASIDHASRRPKVLLNDAKGNHYSIALFNEPMAREHIKVASLLTVPVYEVISAPTATGIELFKYWAAERRKVTDEVRITPFINAAGQLMFRYQTDFDRIDFELSSKVVGVMEPKWTYADRPILQLLELYRSSKSLTLNFCSKGMMTIAVKTTVAKYEFQFPAGRP